MVGVTSLHESHEPGRCAAEAAKAMERAVPMLVRWFTRSHVRASMLADTNPALSATDAWLLGRIADTVPARRSQLARWQKEDRSMMPRQVRGLERLELVLREPEPRDGRPVL